MLFHFVVIVVVTVVIVVVAVVVVVVVSLYSEWHTVLSLCIYQRCLPRNGEGGWRP